MIAPTQQVELSNAIVKNYQLRQACNIVEDVSNMEILETFMTVYDNSASWSARRELLSIIVPFYSLDDIQKYSNVSKYLYGQAKIHVAMHGPGAIIEMSQKQSRIKISDATIDHFLDFMLSPNIISDIPFGQKN